MAKPDMKRAAAFGVAVVIAFAFGCGRSNGVAPSGADGRGIFFEGGRLKAIYEEVPGAPPRLLRWYDTGLGFECQFTIRADSILCRPSATFADYASIVFTDSACTRPATRYEADVEYFDVAATSPCSGTNRLFRAGPRLGAGQPVYLGDPDNKSCTMFDQSGLYWQELGEEIPPSALVSGKAEPEPGQGSARIVAAGLIGSDGSRQIYDAFDAWDVERQETVRPAMFADVSRWGPIAALRTSLFSDASCTVRAAEASCWDSPRKTALVDALPSGTDSGYFDLGPPADPESIYNLSGGCFRISVSATSSMFQLGPAIPSAAFAEVTETALGSGQVTRTAYGSVTGGAPAVVGGFFDSLHQTPCEAATAADGIVRCLPPFASPRALVAFTDEGCTAPVAYATAGPKPSLAKKQVTATSGVAAYDYYPVLDEIAPPDAYYWLSPTATTCSALALDRNSYGFYAVGAKIPVEAFVTVTTVRPL